MYRPRLPAAGLAAAVLIASITGAIAAPRKKPEPGSRALFDRRILPLMRASNPSSCAECHLSGVDLKDYIRPTEAETYASLVKQGLADPRRPAASRLLRLIRMSKPRSALLTQRARETEYSAFAAWLAAAARNPRLASGPARPIGPKVANAVIRHARRDRVLASFTRAIWSQEGRCSGCHGQGNAGTARFSRQYGARMAWLLPGDPEGTLKQLLAQKAIDTAAPERSPLLRKGLGELGHGGGVKFVRGDRTYQLFLSWLQDYARVVKGSYRDADSLPPPPDQRLEPIGSYLEIVEGPETWVGQSLRVDLFPWDARLATWSARPVATADRAFDRGHGSILPVFRLVPAGAAEKPGDAKPAPLPAGRYLLKFHLGHPPAKALPSQPSPGFQEHYLGEMDVMLDWKPGRDRATRVTPDLK